MITVEALRQELNLSPEKDALLDLLREQVIAQWERATGRPWSKRVDHVEYLEPDHERTKMIWLHLLPVTTITSVEERYQDSSTWTVLDSTKYVQQEARLEKISGFWLPRIRVTYTGGVDETTCPHDIRKALMVQARFTIERLDGSMIAFRSNNLQGATQFFEKADLCPLFAYAAKVHARKF